MLLRPIKPEKLPIRDLNLTKLTALIRKAYFTLGRFEALTSSVKNPQTVFSLLIKEEALNSLHSQHIDIDKQVVRYEKAWKKAAQTLKKAPISLMLIRKIHAEISFKTQPSKFRTEQNWIGPENAKIEEAYFLPPKPSRVLPLMQNLMHYLHSKEADPLVQLAIFFAQLLIIHPFMDGNGRVGRMLIPLFLYKKKILPQPLFFMSGYFKTHRVRYFQKLYDISADGDWEGWIRFFLTGIIEQGAQNCARVQILKKKKR